MTNRECLSDTCPQCGAQLTSDVKSIPVQGRIQVKRVYRCGLSMQFFYEIGDVQIVAECADGNRPNTGAPVKPSA